MTTQGSPAEVADRFCVIARQFCAVVDSALSMERTNLLGQIYRILPTLIAEAISLPDVRLSDHDNEVQGTNSRALSGKVRQSHQQWDQLCNLLKEKLGDWDPYWQVFDPTKHEEAIGGTLADDIADIYRDLKEGLAISEAESHSAREQHLDMEALVLFSLGQARNRRLANHPCPTGGLPP